MVSPTEIFRHSKASGLSIIAKMNVARYIPARISTTRIDKIRFIFFMGIPFCSCLFCSIYPVTVYFVTLSYRDFSKTSRHELSEAGKNDIIWDNIFKEEESK